MRTLTPAVMLLAIVWLTSGPSAQGLGEVAKREAARRQQVTGGKKYTNENVQEAAAPAAPVSSPAVSAPAGAPEAAAGTGPSPATGEGKAAEPAARDDVKSAEQKRGEQYWRDKAGATRAERDKSSAMVEGLKQRLESLDEQLRSGAGSSHAQERAVTLRALEKAEYSAKALKEEWARLEARAQAAKVPAEWLR